MLLYVLILEQITAEIQTMTLDELLEQHGVEYKSVGEHPHATEGWISVDCPWCSKGWYKFRMGLRLDSPAANCWSCGTHNFFATVSELTGLRIDAIKRDYRRSDSVRWEIPYLMRQLVLPSPLIALQKGCIFSRYLEKRGLDAQEVASKWNIQGIPIHPRFGWRLFIPIEIGNKTVSFTTRSIGNHPDRYLSASNKDGGIPLKQCLYGENKAMSTVIVVEGPVDCWAIGEGCICTFGMTFTKEQVARLSKYPKRIICFDAESRAQKQARKLCKLLHIYPGETVNVVLESGKDASRASKRELKELKRMLA